ncbi:MAG: hypothetical protein ACLFQ8_02755 [Candidatus Aenigmatarchaeota archaeon]
MWSEISFSSSLSLILMRTAMEITQKKKAKASEDHREIILEPGTIKFINKE